MGVFGHTTGGCGYDHLCGDSVYAHTARHAVAADCWTVRPTACSPGEIAHNMSVAAHYLVCSGAIPHPECCVAGPGSMKTPTAKVDFNGNAMLGEINAVTVLRESCTPPKPKERNTIQLF